MAKDNKTEKATPQKIKKAREEGNVARSKDLNNLFSVLVLAAVIYFFGDRVGYDIANSVAELLDKISKNTDMAEYFYSMGILLLKISAPVLVLVYAFHILNYMAQVGFLFSAKIIKPKASRINPKSYFTRLFSRRSIVDILKSLFYMILLGYVAYIIFKRNLEKIVSMIGFNWSASLAEIIREMKYVFLAILIILVVVSIIDFIYQKWEHAQDLKMKKEEVKQEHKDNEGDPEVKGKRKSFMHAILQGAITKKMDGATFIVNNPTHISVALRYDKLVDAAPIVVAKGEDELALYMRTLAREQDIPMVENRPLARSLYYQVEEDEAIPEDLYVAVIEVMRYLIQTKQIEV
ncbi:flagellar type III secretion system protein FlhB [Bacillus sp. S14(2024)]|uniref:flagellar type III secretion system protein FlhB n=1 Tax=Bacillus sp. S14(2024) TaxID=3162884 RepID=UPI003D19562B